MVLDVALSKTGSHWGEVTSRSRRNLSVLGKRIHILLSVHCPLQNITFHDCVAWLLDLGRELLVLLLLCSSWRGLRLLGVTYVPLWLLLSCDLFPFGNCNIISGVWGFLTPYTADFFIANAYYIDLFWEFHNLFWNNCRHSDSRLKMSSLESSSWWTGEKRQDGEMDGSLISKQRGW